MLPPFPHATFVRADGVRFEAFAPGPELAPWVATFWRMRSDREVVVRVLPEGCMNLIGGDIVGSLSHVLLARLAPGDEAVGVRLRPGAFTALYGVPASELVDGRTPLADVVRPRPLRALARDAPPPDPLAALALRAPKVREFAREHGYSERHLRRRLVAATGHSPSAGADRPHEAVLAAGRGESWARTAVDFGFHDESHMIHDIRALADATPRRMLSG